MITSATSTLLFCAGLFVLAFVMIGAFWGAERLMGASAPRVRDR